MDEQQEIKKLKIKIIRLKKENAELKLILSEIVVHRASPLSWIKKKLPWNNQF